MIPILSIVICAVLLVNISFNAWVAYILIDMIIYALYGRKCGITFDEDEGGNSNHFLEIQN